VKLDHFQFQLS